MSKIKKWDEIHGEYVEDEVSVQIRKRLPEQALLLAGIR